MSIDDDDFAHRELCPDGGCIGVLGPDGRCKVCGTIGPGAVADPRLVHRVADSDDDPDDSDENDHENENENENENDNENENENETASVDGELADRELCPDGACLGVLGSDRRCKICGTVAPAIGPG
jgi:hypothetical protein